MSRFIILIYGGAVYGLFLATFLYAIGFIGDIPGLKTIDSAETSALWSAIPIDVVLLGLFAIQHSVMARRGFKRWWTKVVPPSAGRSTFVLAASLVLALVIWQWRPILDPVWVVTDRWAVMALDAVFWTGWSVLLVSTFLINHFELFGVQQVVAHVLDRPVPEPTFKTPGFYRYVRHPIYLGFVLAFWATPTMTAGHLLFAIMTTGYILLGIFFEERDLIAQFGDRYRRYRAEVGMLLPRARTTPVPSETTQRML